MLTRGLHDTKVQVVGMMKMTARTIQKWEDTLAQQVTYKEDINRKLSRVSERFPDRRYII